jgi:site-specific DNA recombinase
MRAAAYTRYSSDEQRSASSTDQLRNIQAHCQRQGWPSPTHYADEAISGAKHSRPGLDRLMIDAEMRRFDVVLVDDLSRLGRDMAETPRLVKLFKFWGVRLVGVSDGVDTERAGYKIEVGLRGLMAEAYLDDLAEKTHRGLTGLALQGYSAGGLPYGYTSSHDGNGYRRQVDPDQAGVVREIFERYAMGHTPRAIAADLNERRIPSPRGGTWAASAINGDRKRGIGLLNNALYIGQQIWNRSHWVRDPMSGKRKRQERPSAEWIITDEPDLAIVDDATWQAVKARQAGLQAALERKPRPGGAAPPKFVLSGLLRCGECGSSYIVVDRYRYGCARHKDRGPAACSNGVKIARAKLEDVLLEGIRSEMLREENYQAFEREVRRLLEHDAGGDAKSAHEALKRADTEINNIMAAIKAGIITDSTKRALQTAEQDKKAAQRALSDAKSANPAKLLPKAREVYQGLVARIAEPGEDVAETRAAVREVTGEITLTRREGALWADFSHSAECQLNVVAGAGFEPTTFGL